MTLDDLNNLPSDQLKQVLANCCGATTWINKMMSLFPIASKEVLFNEAEKKWQECIEADWLEAFTHHPKIGDTASLKKKFAATASLAAEEQSGVAEANEKTITELAEGNRLYENKFGYIFIVCATGKPATEMLAILQSRLLNSAGDEIKIAAEEQNKITKIRLEKLLE